MGAIEIGLAGDVTLHVNGRAVPSRSIARQVPRRILAILALEQRPVSRDELGNILWDGHQPPSWDTALRGGISQIRRSVTDAGGTDPIHTAFGSYALDADVTVDVSVASSRVVEAEDLLRSGSVETAARTAAACAATLTQPMLPGDDGTWFDNHRRILSRLGVRALLVQSAAATALGEHLPAVEYAEHAVRLDQFLEAAHQRLMSAHAAGGNRAEALIAYRRCRELLADELGVDPSATTEAVYLGLLGTADVNPGPVGPVGLPSSFDRTIALSGRTDQLDQLRASFNRAAAGERIGTVITGSAGVGKSRLASELAATAHEHGAIVLHGRFDPNGISSLDAYGELLGQAGVAWPPPSMYTGNDAGGMRNLFASASAPLGRLAAAAPLVIVLDDLHWADRTAAALIGHLLSEATVPRLLLVATSRTDVGAPVHEQLVSDAGTPIFDEVALEPLDADGTTALAEAWAGHRPGADLETWLQERSGGNPLFLTMILQDLAGQGALGLAGGLDRVDFDRFAVPTAVQDHVLSVANRLGPGAQDLLALAAVFGTDFLSHQLAGPAAMSEPAVRRVLDHAVEVRLLGRSNSSPDRYFFAHALIREAVLSQLDDEVRRRHHRAAAQALAAAGDADPGELCRHLLGTDDPADALAAARHAADAVEALADQGLAAKAAELARSVLDRLNDTVGRAEPVIERSELLTAFALVELSRNSVDAGRAHLREAAEIALAVGDPQPLRRLMNGMRASDSIGFDAEMHALVSQLLELAEPDSRVRAVLLCWRSYELARTDPTAASAMASAAIDIARRRVDPELLRSCLHVWHFNSAALTSPTARRDAMQEAVRLDRRVGARYHHGLSWIWLASDWMELGQLRSAEQALDEARSIVARGGPLLLQWFVARTEVMIAVARGDWQSADVALDRASELATQLGSPEAALQTFAQQASVAFHRGTVHELHPVIASLAETPGVPTMIYASHALFSSETRTADAALVTSAAVERIHTMEPTLSYWPALAVTSEAAARTGVAGGLTLVERLQPRGGLHLVTLAVNYLGAVDRLLGNLAAAHGDLDTADSLLTGSLEQHRAMGAVPYVARNAADLARVLKRRGHADDRRRITDLTDEAAELARDYGLAPVSAILNESSDTPAP